MGVRRGIDRKKVGCRSLIDANLEGQVGVNKFELYLGGGVLLKEIIESVDGITSFCHTSIKVWCEMNRERNERNKLKTLSVWGIKNMGTRPLGGRVRPSP